MSHIDNLLAALCPHGVNFQTLEQVFTMRNGYTPPKNDTTAWTDGTVPWFRMDDIRENGQILDDSIQHIAPSAVKGGRLFPSNSILVATSATIGEHALIRVPHLSNQRFTSLALRPEFANRLDMRFVHYSCYVLDEWCRNNTTTSSFASVDMAKFRKFRFPVPPVEVQREIVRILDTFTALEAELKAEMEARCRQYEYYRDTLLSFRGAGKVRWAPMAEVGTFTRGRRFVKDDIVDVGLPAIHYGEIYTHYGTAATSVLSQVREEIVASLRFAEPGDVVIAAVGETVADVGKAVAWLGDGPVAVHDDCFSFSHSENSKFIAYCMQTAALNSEKEKYVSRAKVKRLSAQGLERLTIPVPPLDEQERIVGILDKFDALVNDLSIGLPAELKARRQQYEYYRDKLLTFEEAAA